MYELKLNFNSNEKLYVESKTYGNFLISFKNNRRKVEKLNFICSKQNLILNQNLIFNDKKKRVKA